MNRFIITSLALISLIMTACGNDEPADKAKVIRMSISSETGIMYDLFDTDKRYPIECMLVMTEDNPGVWENLAFGEIEGFTYERGHEYYLDVRKTILANPPQDASNIKYSLVRILQDRQVMDPEEPDQTDIKSEEDIEYHDLCPIEKYEIAPIFEIDSNNDIFYRDSQTLGMDYESCRIYLENILDKADPNFVTFNKIPYMATYSYVISPLTDEIRRVRNDSHGPLFKEVIPEDEFEHICKMNPNEELHYSLILANVYKKALQKLEFTVRKK